MTATTGSDSKITVQRLAGHIGAEIGGVDLGRPLSDDTVAELRTALLEHKVIFFRGQQIGHAEQIAFGERFGELTHAHPHEDAPPQEAPQILTIDPARLHHIRSERRPDSRYASLDNCRFEVNEAESMFRQHAVPFISTTHKSIEEIASTIMHKATLERHF